MVILPYRKEVESPSRGFKGEVYFEEGLPDFKSILELKALGEGFRLSIVLKVFSMQR